MKPQRGRTARYILWALGFPLSLIHIFCGRIATGDYDAVIIGHSQLEKIPLSAERQAAMLQRQIDEITTQLGLLDKDTPRFTVKQMERTRQGLSLIHISAAASGSIECIQRQSDCNSLYDWVFLKDMNSPHFPHLKKF